MILFKQVAFVGLTLLNPMVEFRQHFRLHFKLESWEDLSRARKEKL